MSRELPSVALKRLIPLHPSLPEALKASLPTVEEVEAELGKTGAGQESEEATGTDGSTARGASGPAV